jgi:hypothetical protein
MLGLGKRDSKMRLFSIPILLVLAAVFPVPCAVGQKIRSDAKLTEESVTLWDDIKAALQAKDGEAFFESRLKNSLFPGGANGVHVFRGTIIASRPAEHPSELVLAMADGVQPEATLRLVGGHFNGPITAGSRVAFIGTVSGFQKEPFMLTFDVQGDGGSGPTYALVLAAEASTEDLPDPIPSIQVNYRSRSNTGFIKIDMSGFGMYPFTVIDHGAITEMSGVRLERYLATAGWYPNPPNGLRHYSIEIDGTQTAAMLEVVGLGSLDRQAWVVPTGKGEAALVVVHADGTLIQRVEGIQKIQVSEKQ